MTLSTLDFHYHAGLERTPGFSLADYLAHAQMTGRTVVGISDHIEYYNGDYPFTNDDRPYPIGAAGLWALRKEMENLRPRFPRMKLLFAPEYLSGLDLGTLEDRWTEFADIFLCEMEYKFDRPLDIVERTRQAVITLGQLAALSRHTGKPAALVHPFREAVNRLVYDPPAPDPGVAALVAEKSRLSEDEIGRIFGFDLRSLGKASALSGVPIEVNGQTQYRIRAKLPALYPSYLRAYQIMRSEGATFIPGSDQHHIDEYDQAEGYTGPFEFLGEESLNEQYRLLAG